MNRRAFITSGVVSTSSMAVVACAAVADPHVQWFDDWQAVEREWMDHADDTPEQDAAWAERERLGRLICNTPTQTVQGVRAQYEWFRADLGYVFDGMVGDDFSGILDNLSAGLSVLT